ERRQLALCNVSAEGLVSAEGKIDGIGEDEVVGEIGRGRRGVPHDNTRQLELSGDGGIVVRLLSRSPCAMLHWALTGPPCLTGEVTPCRVVCISISTWFPALPGADYALLTTAHVG